MPARCSTAATCRGRRRRVRGEPSSSLLPPGPSPTDPKQFEARLALGLDLAAARARWTRRASSSKLQPGFTPEPPNPSRAGAGLPCAGPRPACLRPGCAARAALLSALKLDAGNAGRHAADRRDRRERGATRTWPPRPTGACSRPRISTQLRTPRPGWSHLLHAAEELRRGRAAAQEGAGGRSRTIPRSTRRWPRCSRGEGKQAEAVSSLETLHKPGTRADLHVTAMLADLYTQAGDAAKADPLYVQLLAAVA